ncbi:NAD(P)/FAD-dependent oxidoreductase [Lysobacter silvisoli]|uniref:FAD-binding oxidoreductase n=1 Tax=Lysobacter silvisoli TaxID=2293254 RepID=A0A371K497_9GAMM|nr:FAD-dependent oxidoreductase [Lysobacter silvisoli]RDZ28684.1 FAD-binding oxidoreductase [Lysobacter silvisoli]
MDLKSGYPYWAVRNGLMHAFPPLQADSACEVAVIGGGISGALIADELSAHGHEVVVLEQRDIGWGSTAASTALLQYEIDTPLTDLTERYGAQAAGLAYRACGEAVTALAERARGLGGVDFARMDSLYFASKPRHLPALRREMQLRQALGFDVRWLGADALRERHGLRAPGALLSRLGAGVDPYRMTYRLLMRLQRRGVRVHDRSSVVALEPGARSLRLRTEQGATLRAGHAVVAAGYAGQQWLKQRLARNRSSYAFVTDPLPDEELRGLHRSMAWETARPYLYLRGTGDRRLIVGGADDAIDVPARRDARLRKKTKQLLRQLERRFPGLAPTPAFAWAGTFAETADGLPYFGPHPQYGPRVHFAMAYGGNGITYAELGAGMIRALIERRRHPLAQLFGFERLG